ncbi:uncharacterized protein LOC131943079 isoform X2 [Physella acuta]|uniref:uncharacterized protein LOC131943079 isoform X2 n=1 Tax=Physella acuta TaxID=109671 RepID=UPI0027DE0D4C|nr:uncharacterized protein LOC131943079 isoform X2 [Physella acuta]
MMKASLIFISALLLAERHVVKGRTCDEACPPPFVVAPNNFVGSLNQFLRDTPCPIWYEYDNCTARETVCFDDFLQTVKMDRHKRIGWMFCSFGHGIGQFQCLNDPAIASNVVRDVDRCCRRSPLPPNDVTDRCSFMLNTRNCFMEAVPISCGLQQRK